MLGNRTLSPRCCSVPLPECPEHFSGKLYHEDFNGCARPRASLRLHPNEKRRSSARPLALTEKRRSRSFLLRLHPNGKRCSRLFLLTLTMFSFANCKRNPLFSALFMHCNLRNPIIKCHFRYWKWSVDAGRDGYLGQWQESSKLKKKTPSSLKINKSFLHCLFTCGEIAQR